MFGHSTNAASFFSVLMAALIFSLSLAGSAAAQGNTRLGTGALQHNTTGQYNTASGFDALLSVYRSPPLFTGAQEERLNIPKAGCLDFHYD